MAVSREQERSIFLQASHLTAGCFAGSCIASRFFIGKFIKVIMKIQLESLHWAHAQARQNGHGRRFLRATGASEPGANTSTRYLHLHVPAMCHREIFLVLPHLSADQALHCSHQIMAQEQGSNSPFYSTRIPLHLHAIMSVGCPQMVPMSAAEGPGL